MNDVNTFFPAPSEQLYFFYRTCWREKNKFMLRCSAEKMQRKSEKTKKEKMKAKKKAQNK
jgi:hypothetical protein